MRAARLARELETLEKHPIPGVAVWPREDSLCSLEARLQGPPASPYEGGVFNLAISVPERYPFEPPLVKFNTKVYHPNIDSQGRICLSSLKLPPAGSWQPSLNIGQVVSQIRLLLDHPNPDDPLMPEISELYITNKPEFERVARHLTKEFAAPNRGQLDQRVECSKEKRKEEKDDEERKRKSLSDVDSSTTQTSNPKGTAKRVKTCEELDEQENRPPSERNECGAK